MTGRLGSGVTALAAVAFAAGLMWLSLPRLQAEFIALSPLARIADPSRVKVLDAPAAKQIALELERAIGKWNSPRYSHGAITMYNRMIQATPKAERAKYYALAQAAIVRELSVRPMQARLWWNLSYIAYFRSRAPTRYSRDAILKSIDVQEYALSLVPIRLRLLLSHWTMLSENRRAEFKSQFVQTWRRDPYGLIALAKKKPYTSIIRDGLSNEPAMLAGLDVGLGYR